MANRLQPLNLVDFTGGINLRADAFQLGENESPSMLNVEVDPRGGFHTRRGWESVNAIPISRTFAELESTSEEELLSTSDEILLGGYLGPWNPVYMVTDNENAYIANEYNLIRVDGDDAQLILDEDEQPVEYSADLGPSMVWWGGPLYVASGNTENVYRVHGNTAETLTVAGSSGWQNDYADPGVSLCWPKAFHAATHAGYMFVAHTVEGDDVEHPFRVRWSHPNNPTAWAENDYIDIVEGASPILALISFSDHLLIFKENSVWALYGYDSESWQVVNVTRDVGVVHKNAVAASPQGVFFLSWHKGVFFYSRDGIVEVSEQLRPMFDVRGYSASHVWMCWMANRLWVSLPWDPDDPTLDDGSLSVFVFDPSIGAWVRHTTGDGAGIGPFASAMFGGDQHSLACARSGAWLMLLERDGAASDRYGTTTSGFSSHFTTRWLTGDWPTLRKSWRRPDVVFKERSAAYRLRCAVYRDYDEVASVRAFNIAVGGGAEGGFWRAAEDSDDAWGGGGVWGKAGAGSRIGRASNLGLARSVQVKFEGEPGADWGIDAVVFKFVPRRFR